MKAIPLSGRVGQGMVALVDDDLYEQIAAIGKWRANRSHRARTWYARNRKHGLMHKVVYRLATGMSPQCLDHRDRNGLNNQVTNLRPATGTLNNANTGVTSRNRSGFRGVSFFRRDGTWRASIRHNGEWRHLGYYPGTEAGKIEAARAYNRAAIEHFGDFAVLNPV
ncbi:MAG: Fis family transcriptional regulator [Chloroflexi bacterium]|nr:Fis family transcriptional regulator [Chloroflexota bacterium]